MPLDPLENEVDATIVNETPPPDPPTEEIEEDLIDVVETSPQWTAWRDSLAIQMYNDWLVARGQGGNH